MTKRVEGCSESTLGIYHLWLGRFVREVCVADPLAAHRFASTWQERGLKPATLQRGIRALKVFFRWCVSTGSLPSDPLRDVKIRLPKTLPQVPTEEELRVVLVSCGDGLVPADSLPARLGVAAPD